MSDDKRHLPTRVIEPLGPRVLVRIIPPDQRSSSGLYLPAGVEDKGTDAMYGEVLAVARAAPLEQDQFEGKNVSGIPDRARILFAPESGFRVPWDDSLRLVETKSVLAVVEEIKPEQAH
jgi:co-chaperonin GroES (HSP10)